MIDSRLRHYVQNFFNFLSRPFIALGIMPTQITLAAAFFGVMSWGFTMVGTFPFRMAALFVGVLSALCDILDGTVARLTQKSSPLGAFLDLILDRVIEGGFILSFAYAFPQTIWPGMFFLLGVIINFSIFLVAGSLFSNKGKKSIHYEDGLVERTETFILFALMLLFPTKAPVFIWIFNGAMLITIVIRFTKVVRFANMEREL